MLRLPKLESHKLLREEKIGHLAVVDGSDPYVTPMSYVTDGRTIGFRTRPGRKLDAIDRSLSASFEIAKFDEATGSWRSVVVTGRVVRVTDPEKRREVRRKFFTKYAAYLGSGDPGADDLDEDAVVLSMSIDEISGRYSGGFRSTQVRPGRL